jgi:sortase (surface protein transpeptidase)
MRRAIALIGLGALVAAGGLVASWNALSASHHQSAAHASSSVAHASARPSAAAVEPSQDAGMAPTTLVIPSIGVKAKIEPVGVNSQGAMDMPVDPDDVGWYAPGPWPPHLSPGWPGQQGDAVIAGHYDWYIDPSNEATGTAPSVFAQLDQLAVGASVEIDFADGAQKQEWTVTDRETVPYDSHPAGLFSHSGTPTLSLVTCAGTWISAASTYSERLVVNATLA